MFIELVGIAGRPIEKITLFELVGIAGIEKITLFELVGIACIEKTSRYKIIVCHIPGIALTCFNSSIIQSG